MCYNSLRKMTDIYMKGKKFVYISEYTTYRQSNDNNIHTVVFLQNIFYKSCLNAGKS